MTFQRFDIQSQGRTELTPVGNDLDWLDEPQLPAKEGLQAIREARRLSLCDLAHRAGMLPDHVRALESGLRPTPPEIQMLARALGVSEEALG